MSLKLEKIAAEREKARRKRDEWEERRKEWDRKYHEQENSEICEMVHAQSLTPEQLAVIIQLAQAAVPNPENLKLDEKEPLRPLHLPIRAMMCRRTHLSIPLRRKRMQQEAQMQGKRTIPTASKSTRICRCCRMAMRFLRMRMGT